MSSSGEVIAERRGRDLRRILGAIAETIVVSLLVPTIGFFFNRRDPFMTESPFTWVVVGPLLVGLRHGFAAGFTSAMLVDALMIGSYRLGFVDKAPPSQLVLGTIAIGMLCGQVAQVWRRDRAEWEVTSRSLELQLDEALRNGFLLEIANERLHAQLGEGAVNLREAMIGVRKIAADVKEPTLAMLASSSLDVFAEYCHIEAATIHSVFQAQISPKAVAQLGGAQAVPATDPLVRAALNSKKLAVVPLHGGQLAHDTRLLAAVPFVDTSDDVRGVLCIEAMPLAAFERKNLQTLFLLCGHFADLLAARGEATELERGRRAEFQKRVGRALRDLVESDIPAIVVGLSMGRASAVSDIIEDIIQTLRQADFPLVLRTAQGAHLLLVLMPITSEAQAVERRIEAMVERELHRSLGECEARIFTHVLAKTDTPDTLRELLLAKARGEA
ncbi:MAG: hypothetical protein IPJ34_10290 [Myxococcales bacterium]|nr:hypothetical protein [Myxococcales bacterium]